MENRMQQLVESLRPVNLHLFEGGAGGGAAGGAAGGTGAAGGGDGTGAAAIGTKGGKDGGPTVVYGKQKGVVTSGTDQASDPGDTPATAVQTTSDTLEARRKAFRDMVSSDEYRDIYAQETQRLIDRRFRETKSVEQQVQAQQPIIDLLAQRYGVTDGDLGKLAQALESDSAYWQEAADEAGMSVDQYMQMQKLQRENAQLLAAQKRQEGAQAAQAQLQKWYGEAEQVKAKFPGFDLAAEVQNPQFLSMLKSGVPVEHAYKVIHMDEIVSNAMLTTASQTEQRVVSNIRAKGARPAENGTQAKAPFTVKDDVSKLSAKDRREIVKRALRGEHIEF